MPKFRPPPTVARIERYACECGCTHAVLFCDRGRPLADLALTPEVVAELTKLEDGFRPWGALH